ncbi:hypothetical protein [Polaribacter sp. Hel1_85]|uniref:hypothetical protein n=1 Tax=Polaribacter sp. Hel1_85 TaxID=1250005 RepID=UPI00052DCA75|nr:hypothetical protein [Polaribacter sp. Hel1_85]KGL62830.1 hypothetical protein PHEL85_2626 [Polaribacter sp. Hel1_85]
MKNTIKNIGLFAIVAVFFASCEDDNDNTGASLLNYSPATVTLSSTSNTVFDESAIDADDESTYVVTITATLPSPQPVNAVIDLVQSGGTASASDFSAGTITIPAGSLTASADVEIMQTGDIEGTETLDITGKARANFNITPYTFSASIENDYINDHLEFSTTWSGSYTYELSTGTAENTVDFCGVDIDVLAYELATGNYYDLGGTGSCTETGSMGELPDGDYYVLLYIYGNPYATLGQTEIVPVSISYSQEHFDTSGSFVSEAVTLATPEQELLAVAQITKSGYNFTVTPL